MKLENFAEKGKGAIKNGLMGLLIAGSAVSGVRCAAALSTDEQILLAEILMQTDDVQGARVGSLLYNDGIRKYNRELVREGSNININSNSGNQEVPENVNYSNGTYTPVHGYIWTNKNPNDFSVVKSLNFFTCNDAQDFNGNDYIEWPEEYRGFKTKFRENEKLVIGMRDLGGELSGKKSNKHVQIFGPKGNIVYEASGIKFNSANIGNDGSNLSGYLIQEAGGYGTFTVDWYDHDKHIGSNKFEIIPNKK